MDLIISILVVAAVIVIMALSSDFALRWEAWQRDL